MNNRILTSIMAIIFIAALTIPSYAQHGRGGGDCSHGMQGPRFEGHPGGHGGQGFGMRMAEELDLTKDQKTKIQNLKSAHQKQMIPMRADVKVLHIELRDLIRADASRGTIEKASDKISALKAQIQKLNLNHRLDMREILTPEQREKWDSKPHFRGKGNDCGGNKGFHGKGGGRGSGRDI